MDTGTDDERTVAVVIGRGIGFGRAGTPPGHQSARECRDERRRFVPRDARASRRGTADG
jgi:hypothetical protein